MSTSFIMPSMNIMGENALADAVATLGGRGFAKALIVTDAGLARLGVRGRCGPRARRRRDHGGYLFRRARAPIPPFGNVGLTGLGFIRQHGASGDRLGWAANPP